MVGKSWGECGAWLGKVTVSEGHGWIGLGRVWGGGVGASVGHGWEGLGRVRGMVGKGWGECGAWLGRVGASAGHGWERLR